MSDYPPPPPPPPGSGWGSPLPPPPRPESYSVGNAFGYALRKFQENLLPLVLITLVLLVAAGVVQVFGNLITTALTPDIVFNFETGEYDGGGRGFLGLSMILGFLFGALSFVVNLVVQSGIIKASLALTRGHGIDVGNAFRGIDWAQVVIAALVIGALTFVGLLLCVLPGLLVVFFTSYTLYFVIDRDQDAITALRSSVAMVKDNIGVLVLFFLASLAAYVVGACLCGVGLLAAIPIVVVAQAYTFRTLNGDPVTA